MSKFRLASIAIAVVFIMSSCSGSTGNISTNSNINSTASSSQSEKCEFILTNYAGTNSQLTIQPEDKYSIFAKQFLTDYYNQKCGNSTMDVDKYTKSVNLKKVFEIDFASTKVDPNKQKKVTLVIAYTIAEIINDKFYVYFGSEYCEGIDYNSGIEFEIEEVEGRLYLTDFANNHEFLYFSTLAETPVGRDIVCQAEIGKESRIYDNNFLNERLAETIAEYNLDITF